MSYAWSAKYRLPKLPTGRIFLAWAVHSYSEVPGFDIRPQDQWHKVISIMILTVKLVML